MPWWKEVPFRRQRRIQAQREGACAHRWTEWFKVGSLAEWTLEQRQCVACKVLERRCMGPGYHAEG